MAVTLKDVARESGFNLTTVSLVLNNHPNAEKFKSETKARIHETVAKLGYQPNLAARSLVMQKVNSIGVVIPDHVQWHWGNPYYAAILNGANRACQDKQFNVLTFCCKMDNVEKFVFPNGISRGNVGGLLLCGGMNPQIISRFKNLNLPFARIGQAMMPEEYESGTFFAPDINKGLNLAVGYLANQGHKRIACMFTGTSFSHSLAENFTSELKRKQPEMSTLNIFTPDIKCDTESAKQFISEYFNLPAPQRPSALIANPQTCLGVVKELKSFNMKCPDDLSLIGAYDFVFFDYSNPGITSISYDNEAIALHAAEQLIKRINQKGKTQEPLESKTDFPVSLNIRESCSHP
jgi:LacI family transcriptional regulator